LPTRLVFIGVPLLVIGLVLAVSVDVVAFGGLVVLGATFSALAGVLALGDAMRLALRPQRVKYDHSWPTNVLGGTSTPHPGPAADEAQNIEPQDAP
jgi:hypothetical protein